MEYIEIKFLFMGDLPKLLYQSVFEGAQLRHRLKRRASIKDILESLNIPHTEIGKIEAGGSELSFSFVPEANLSLKVYPFTIETIKAIPSTIWPEQWSFAKFLVDINVLKLARNLRMAGIDSVIVPEKISLKDIGSKAEQENRVVLTRNRELLKCATVKFGQLIRSQNHLEQLSEVIERFGLLDRIEPFKRCMVCNGILHHADKDEIFHMLEPLTKKYYNKFKRCSDCSNIYWRGSHYYKMRQHLDGILNE